jgi:hypothetical protein
MGGLMLDFFCVHKMSSVSILNIIGDGEHLCPNAVSELNFSSTQLITFKCYCYQNIPVDSFDFLNEFCW